MDRVYLQTNLEESSFNPGHGDSNDSLCVFSQMTYLISHVTCLNNTRGWLYESPHNGSEEILPNQFGGKLYPVHICASD